MATPLADVLRGKPLINTGKVRKGGISVKSLGPELKLAPLINTGGLNLGGAKVKGMADLPPVLLINTGTVRSGGTLSNAEHVAALQERVDKLRQEVDDWHYRATVLQEHAQAMQPPHLFGTNHQRTMFDDILDHKVAQYSQALHDLDIAKNQASRQRSM